VVIQVAHLSDTHFGGPARARQRVELVLDHLLAMDPLPDLLLVTGDIADHGEPEEYAEAREVLDRWTGLRLLGPGNHDVRTHFARGLLDREVHRDDRLDQVLDLPAARFLMLDSLVGTSPGERIDHGELSEATLAWLDARLSEDPRPTYVCLHHPPVEIGVRLMDPIRLRDAEAFAQVLQRHPHHVATLVGHAHTQGASMFAGRPMLIGGGVASVVTVDSEPLLRVWEGALPSFALHLIDDKGRLTTHWRSL
jgi:Icc protein